MKRTFSMILPAALVAGFLSTPVRSDDTPLMHVVESDATILVMRGEKTILQYNKKPTEEAARHEPHFTRSGYIHPVYSPSGREVTGDYAPDHKHQHGLFFAWTKTGFEGRETEFWNQKLEKGSVAYERTVKVFGGDGKCGFVVEQLWKDITAPGGAKTVLAETWELTAHDAGEEHHVFDIASTQEAVGGSPLRIKKYHYGGMAIRGNGQWYVEDKNAEPPGVMITSEGLGRIEGNHSRPRWVAMHGPVDDGHAGVAVLGHPGNFRFPQWVRLHPNKPYFVFAPMVEEPFEIAPAEPYVSRYRYVVFDGEPDAKGLDAEWEKLGSSRGSE